MKSAIYEGQVKHRRTKPREHAFDYRVFMVLLDLAELDSVFEGRWFWSTRRPALARFRREDHVGDPATPLARSVRELVKDRTGKAPEGPIRLLTNLSYFGYCFNPVSFYYCYDRDDRQVETIVAEVNNTPWGEQICYVLDGTGKTGGAAHQGFAPLKQMHVSPFMPMDVDYEWRFSEPLGKLGVYMQNALHGEKIFDASLNLKRKEITGASLARVLLMYPFMTLKVIVAIHWQALRLWLKRVPVYDHAKTQEKLQGKHV